MKLIDADRLLQHTKFYNLKNGNRTIDEVDILHAQTVNAIPLDKVKQAKKEIESLSQYGAKFSDEFATLIDRKDVLEIINKLIESED